jgi:error-prone DNA polymerase
MTAAGLSAEYAQRVFEQIRGFGEYGFPESHAASFALLVYVSAWMKHYYPAAFATALLNSQPMGFYAPAQLVRDARAHGVEVRTWDVNHSDWDCTLEAMNQSSSINRQSPITNHQSIVRLGLRLVIGLPRADADRIIAARAAGPFASLADLAARTGLSRAALARLAKADAFGSLGLDRRGALWQALGEGGQASAPRDGAASGLLPFGDADEPPAALVPLSERQEVTADYAAVGLSLRPHPLSFYRPKLDELRVLRSEQLATWPAGRQVRVAGLVLVRQRPSTAGGITFVTLEDETGVANLIVRPRVWEQWRQAAKRAAVMLAHGQLQREGQVIHVLVNKLEDLAPLLGSIRDGSRNFR